MSEKYRKGSGQRWVASAWGDGEHYRELDIFDGVAISEGGWFYGKTWMTAADAAEARSRWYRARDAESPKDEHNYVEHQCGGCKFFGDLDGNWGLCWNARSPQDGRLVFEHNGCTEHSELTLSPIPASPEGSKE